MYSSINTLPGATALQPAAGSTGKSRRNFQLTSQDRHRRCRLFQLDKRFYLKLKSQACKKHRSYFDFSSGLRHPSTLAQTDMSSTAHRPNSMAGSQSFPTVIAMYNGAGTSVEFVPEGLDRLGLCQPSYEWQSESERFPGLTPVGVDIVEMVWAGCVAVLGIGC